jgi:hypothetical protein
MSQYDYTPEPNNDPPEIRRANGNLIYASAVAGFVIALIGLGAFYLYASRGTENAQAQTPQIQQAQNRSDKGAEPPRQNNPNPPGDRAN